MKVGTVVLARWSSTKYPAKVKEILPKKRLLIQFYDGVETQTDMLAVQKLEPALQKEVCIQGSNYVFM